MTSASLIEERLPVWSALSDFFLDNELTPSDYKFIALALAKSSYSIDELKKILENEVYPPCHRNLLAPVGRWGTFSETWIKERIAPRLGKRRRLDALGIPPIHRWMYRDHWSVVKNQIKEIREKLENS